MQQVITVLAASIIIFLMQCSENESLSVFNESTVKVSAPPITKEYSFLPYFYRLRNWVRPDSIDESIEEPIKNSIKWLFEFRSGEESRVSIILSGQIETDSIDDFGDTTDIGIGQNHIELSVETHTDDLPESVQITFDQDGVFLDTVLIAVSSLSGLVLPQNSRLFVKAGDFIFDTIPLINPYDAGEQ